MEKKIRVLVVDDSAFYCQLISRLLAEHPIMEVVDTAMDAFDAREKIKKHNPDVVTLDIEMPGMNGLDFLEKIMSLRPMPVVMVSTLTRKGADATLRALALGAVDFIEKPSQGIIENFSTFREELVYKVSAASKARVQALKRSSEETKIVKFLPPAKDPHNVVVIGSSTGGVEALYQILPMLPQGSPPILLVQHMPPAFVSSLIAHLNEKCGLDVIHATHDTVVESGKIYIAPGDHHLELRRSGKGLIMFLQEGPKINGHIPSVDRLFKTAAQAVGARAVGVILTGMGRDGAEGMRMIRDNGGATLGQNAATCVVYGMPKAALEEGGVALQVGLLDLPNHIMKACGWKSH